jgi:hypothetical protein
MLPILPGEAPRGDGHATRPAETSFRSVGSGIRRERGVKETARGVKMS